MANTANPGEISAPVVKATVPIALTQVLSWLGIVTMIKDSLVAQKVTIPGALPDAITKMQQIIASFENGSVPPNSIQNDLSDLFSILGAVQTQTGQMIVPAGIHDVMAAIGWTQIGLNDLVAGQWATVATSHISYEGKAIPLALMACRMDQGAAAISAGFIEAPAQAAQAAESAPEPPATQPPV